MNTLILMQKLVAFDKLPPLTVFRINQTEEDLLKLKSTRGNHAASLVTGELLSVDKRAECIIQGTPVLTIG